jgi:type IV pilus assembly protein PilE
MTRMKNGFSLIELVFVLAIVSIMAVIAYPSYSNLIMRAHKLDGQLALFHLAQQLEQHYANTQDYRTMTITNPLSPHGFYTLHLANISQTTYVLHARLKRTTENTQCQILTLDNTGLQGLIPCGD